MAWYDAITKPVVEKGFGEVLPYFPYAPEAIPAWTHRSEFHRIMTVDLESLAFPALDQLCGSLLWILSADSCIDRICRRSGLAEQDWNVNTEIMPSKISVRQGKDVMELDLTEWMRVLKLIKSGDYEFELENVCVKKKRDLMVLSSKRSGDTIVESLDRWIEHANRADLDSLNLIAEFDTLNRATLSTTAGEARAAERDMVKGLRRRRRNRMKRLLFAAFGNNARGVAQSVAGGLIVALVLLAGGYIIAIGLS